MSHTPNFSLPLLFAAQAQKEITHNEALVLVDALLAGCVEAVLSDPVGLAPEEGRSWIVGASPVGAWAGHAADIAIYSAGGWRFAPGVIGMRLYDRAAGVVRIHDGISWPAPPAVTAAAGGATVDDEARATLVGVLSILRTYGLVDAT